MLPAPKKHASWLLALMSDRRGLGFACQGLLWKGVGAAAQAKLPQVLGLDRGLGKALETLTVFQGRLLVPDRK